MTTKRIPLSRQLAAVALVAGIGLAGCSSSSSPGNGASATSATSSPGNGASATSATAGATSQVLPVKANPIKNTSTVKALEISSVLVENNVDPKTKKTTDDHLEVALRNTGTTDLTNVEVFYTFTDTKTNDTESYYLKLPSTFIIPASGTRIAHFDNTGATDHFPVNKYSLYATSKNPQKVAVIVSADGAKPSRRRATTVRNLAMS